MNFSNAIWLIILGAMAASGAIVSKRPDAKQLLDKLAPYQGWSGLVSGIWGIFGLVYSISLLGWFKLGIAGIIAWLFWVGMSLLLIGLGSILGTGLAKTYVKDAKAQEKMDQLYNKLAPYRDTVGFVAIGFAIVDIVITIIAF